MNNPTHALGALLFTLMLGLLPALPRAEHSIADDRVLRVLDGAAEQQYTVLELIAAIGLTELPVAKDPHSTPRRCCGPSSSPRSIVLSKNY